MFVVLLYYAEVDMISVSWEWKVYNTLRNPSEKMPPSHQLPQSPSQS